MNPLVYLVGAGPGDVGLLTMRAAEIIKSADLIVHDTVVSRDILDLRKPGCRLTEAGIAGFDNPRWQRGLAHEMADRAKRGLTVCRLKSGDPLIFSNGAETIDLLHELGCRVEIIPGLTSGLAGAVRAGIPVTHTSVPASVCLVSAHRSKIPLNYAAMANSGTIVLYMFRRRIAEIAAGLINTGMPLSTPVCFVEHATWPEQRIVRANLGSMTQVAREEAIGRASVCLIGDAVSRTLPVAADHAGRQHCQHHSEGPAHEEAAEGH